jgi:AcrR family transcriptional regulator
MARPQLATDQEILAATGRVMARRGPDAFTLSEVADEVGLSRAAIILRFKSTEALKIAFVRGQVERFARALGELPAAPGGDSLIELAAFIGRWAGRKSGAAGYLVERYGTDARQRTLAALERKRADALMQAISRAMPKLAVDHDSAVALFRANLSGGVLAWIAEGNSDAESFLVEHTKKWLTLAGIPYSERNAGVSSQPQARPARNGVRGTAKRTRAASVAEAQ